MEPRKDSLPGVDADEPTVRSTMPTREPSFLHSPGIVPPGAPDSEGKMLRVIYVQFSARVFSNLF